MGSEGDTFPEHVGFPMGEDLENPSYYILEMHYDNPRFDQDISDNSGLRIFYTDKLREFDLGTLAIFEYVSMLHAIPPQQKDFKSVGRCNSYCTETVMITSTK